MNQGSDVANKETELHSVIFFGTPPFAVYALDALLKLPWCKVKAVVTQPDRPAGRGTKVQVSPVKEVALQNGLPILQPENIRKSEAQFLAELMPLWPLDLGIVVAFGQILPASTLSLPRKGCVNIHASLLPRWRGAAPIQRALMEGDSKTGICLMKMEAGLDTGPIYSTSELAIGPLETFGSLHDKLGALAATLLSRDLLSIIQGERTPKPQAEEGVTTARKIGNQECEIDWANDAVAIERKIRALCPLPGAYTFLGGKRFKILGATIDSMPLQGEPGTVVALQDGTLSVQCGRGSLKVLELQIEGKRRMTCHDFLKGHRIDPNTRVGHL